MICAFGRDVLHPRPSCNELPGSRKRGGSGNAALERYVAKGADLPAARVREWLNSLADSDGLTHD